MAEYKRLVDGCDRYYFGIDGEPQIVPESTESKPRKSGDGPE